MFSKLRQLTGYVEDEEEDERRRGIRHASVVQIAKMVMPAYEELCVVRDVSPGGLRADIYRSVAIDDDVTIDFRTGHRIAGRVAWTRDQLMGVQFIERASIASILAHCSFDDRMSKVRPPRIDAEVPGVLLADGEELEVRTCNVSMGGVKILTDRDLRPDTPCAIRLDGLDRRKGVIRWSHEGQIGIMLTQSMSYPEFVGWRRSLLGAAPL